MNNTDPLLPGTTIKRHILKTDTQQTGKDSALQLIKIMPMHRDMIRKHPIQHIEIISHPMRFHIRENTEMVEKT